VHDENAWALGGVSGHAGLFSTAEDVAIFCQMILNNGTYGTKRILKPETVDLMFTNFNTAFPGNEHSIGFELNQSYFSGPMANMLAGGHTGFTGTTLVVDRASDTFMVMLGHRVYPNRNWASNNIVREAIGYWVARSLGRDVSFP
jgi:CubicO group peptidase (beta-lactamase class C family)